jgi:hypothetical protein
VSLAVPVLGLLAVHQAQICLVHQSSRLQGLSWPFLGQLLRRQFAKLVINNWQELLGGTGVALLDGRQEERNVAQRRLRDLAKGMV